jgi:ferrous iron transport protein A
VKKQPKSKKPAPLTRPLAGLRQGETATVAETPNGNERLAEIGLVKGEQVTFVKTAPLGDPVILRVLDAAIIVRRAEIEQVLVR